MLSASQIVEGLRGTNAAARFFGVKPPSVTEWVKNGCIPEDKLIRKAALLEQRLPGFSRRTQFAQHVCQDIWPDLAGDRVADPQDGEPPAVPGATAAPPATATAVET